MTVVSPQRSDFLDLASRYPVVPVWRTVLADRETPVSAYQKLTGNGPGFLLESVEGGERWARWSFLGWDPAFTLVSRAGESKAEVALPEGDPLEVLERLVERYRAPDLPGLPPLHSGLVGYLGYDCVRYIERLPNPPPDDRGLPEMVWHAVGALAAFDRFAQTITLVRNVFIGDQPQRQYEQALASLDADVERLGSALPYQVVERQMSVPFDPGISWTSTLERADYEAAVLRIKEYIRQGDAYQVVVSQRLETRLDADSFSIYRALRMINPSPFLFYVRHPEVAVIGSSPELMTRVRDGMAYSRPIAGTRARGETEEADRALEEELLADPKERAEHVMLVDLARNDLGRVCEFGTVQVDELMVIERYSHVMHIVSGVSGKIRPGVGPVDVIRATFPHGTVSGAPKVRAMEIIDELEPVQRGPYAGAAGYLDFSGNVDTAICLRTVVAAGDKAWVQAGGGVVADSQPEAEYQESMNKAAAALSAIEMANRV
jgi:anthranilate synthase component I